MIYHGVGCLRFSPNEVDDNKAMNENLRADSNDLYALKHALQKLDEAFALSEDRGRLANVKLETCYAELASLANSLLLAEDKLSQNQEALNWLLEVNRLTSGNPWWWKLMAAKWRRQREFRRLALLGLFDAQAYLARYPDVQEAGLDPLHHYMSHGIREISSGSR